jgi:hypothetical protein
MLSGSVIIFESSRRPETWIIGEVPIAGKALPARLRRGFLDLLHQGAGFGGEGAVGFEAKVFVDSSRASEVRETRRSKFPFSRCAPARSGFNVNARFTSSYAFSSAGLADKSLISRAFSQ